LLTTIKALLLHRQHLFQGLAIHHQPWDWPPCPILHLDFSIMNPKRPELLLRDLQSQLMSHFVPNFPSQYTPKSAKKS
ncbi:hypothetical protein, partial [Salmonella enterica]|uniref:hypothetical protein n=1 Tax=Salmonella enterica TaxID=28901 RepID=UPI003D2708EE